jgi:SAM-dependent methyltransferase
MEPKTYDQVTLWNGRAGQAWVAEQETLDGMFAPLEELLTGAIPLGSPARVLDIGCGTGATTLAAARRLEPQGECVGLDISEPMVTVARARAADAGLRASFVCADAQTHAFDAAGFDVLMSRFGVMFFADSVAAFSNLRSAASDGARLRFIAWRSATVNPFMTTALRAAAPLLPSVPQPPPDGPGQFAFAAAPRVQKILEDSGWAEIDIRPLDVTCRIPEERLLPYIGRLGPLSLVLDDVDATKRAHILATARRAFDPFVHGDEVRFVAACWDVSARRR